MRRYHIDVFCSDEDACWVANIPDLRFCSAFGDTSREALAELLVAQELWIGTPQERRYPVPEPCYVSAASQPHRTLLTFREDTREGGA